MAYSFENAALQVQERLKLLNSLVHEIEGERVKGEQTLESISKTHDKINQEGRFTPYNQQKLKGLYNNALNEALQEEELLRQALTKINEIRNICNERRLQARSGGNRETFHRGALMKMLQVSAQTLPLWTGSPEASAPPLCGAIPADSSYIAKTSFDSFHILWIRLFIHDLRFNKSSPILVEYFIAEPGDMVAALAKNVEGHEDRWILAEVVSFNSITRKYEVDDIDEEQKLRHTLSRRQVVPLPLMRANPETDPYALFQEGAVVMALYPQTTCFYKAIVNQLPTSVLDDYELIFEDSSYPDGYAPPLKVAQRYVIEIKERKKS